MPKNSRRSVTLTVALALFLVPGGMVSAAPVPGGGSPAQQASTASTGIVPHVGSLPEYVATVMIEDAGFIPRSGQARPRQSRSPLWEQARSLVDHVSV